MYNSLLQMDINVCNGHANMDRHVAQILQGGGHQPTMSSSTSEPSAWTKFGPVENNVFVNLILMFRLLCVSVTLGPNV